MEKDATSITDNDSARPWQSYNTVYTTAKAGMEGVDKEKVQKIVYEMSKGSKYFANEEKKEAYMNQKIESMRLQLAKLSDLDLAHHQKIADRKIVELEATRDLSRIWLHVDMDAFYAACETLCDPTLKGKPMAVGGMSMISTANYEARKFGVRAAMPGFIARKLCPELIFVPVDFKKYTHYSDLTRKVFQKYDPNFLAASLDEAYLDITNFCNDNGITGAQVAAELREGVHRETGLTCSAGVAANRLLAKVCSDINKPNGQFVLPNERAAVMTFISSLPIRKIGGIGKVTENILKGVLGITTCEEMLQKSSYICALFSHTSADFFISVGLGIGGTDKPQASQRKSMSTERTFSPTGDEAFIHRKLVDLSENLSADMKKEDLRGKTLTLKLKTSCFEVRTRAVTLPHYICSGEDIFKHAVKLLKAELPVSLRLMGLRMSNFSDGTKGVAADSKQKTLSSFILTEGSTSGRVHRDEALSNLDTLATCRETGLCSDIHEPSESIGFEGTNEISEFDETNITPCNKDGETREGFENQIDDFNDNGADHDTSGNANPFPMFWLHDYQCSVCGTELPPSFIEERQEHFDFHLAERLQDEESSSFNRINVTPTRRSVAKDRTDHSRQKKRQKASPSQVEATRKSQNWSRRSQMQLMQQKISSNPMSWSRSVCMKKKNPTQAFYSAPRRRSDPMNRKSVPTYLKAFKLYVKSSFPLRRS